MLQAKKGDDDGGLEMLRPQLQQLLFCHKKAKLPNQRLFRKTVTHYLSYPNAHEFPQETGQTLQSAAAAVLRIF